MEYYDPYNQENLQFESLDYDDVNSIMDSMPMPMYVTAQGLPAYYRSPSPQMSMSPHYTTAQMIPGHQRCPSSCRRRSRKPVSPEDNSMSMLSVALSFVMTLAYKTQNIPEDYIECAENYFKCVKNEHGQRPENIAKILKLISPPEEHNSNKKCACPSSFKVEN